MTTKISILHPSRSRPDRSFETIDKWRSLSGISDHSMQIIISLDEDDPQLYQYKSKYDDPRCYYDFIVTNNKSAVDAINNAAKVSKGNILIVVSDDTDCRENWAVDLLKHLEGNEDFIVKCQDGIQGWIITMPVMDRKYYNRFGYVYYPEFRHMFCDTFLTCVADLLGRKIELPMSFPHLHYSIGASQRDALSERADATWKQGEDLFLELVKKNYLLEPEQIKGKITDESYRAWIASKISDIR